MNVLGLVQLTQSTQHAGGYSYSFGVESLAARHELTSGGQLILLLKDWLRAAIAPADGVASGIIFRAARAGEFDAIPRVCHAMSSDRLPVEMRLASLQMGTRLWELSRHWEWARSVHEQLDPLAKRNDLHHAVAFGALVSETTSSQVRAIAAYLLNVARSLIDAAVRAIPLDEREGQRVLARVQPTLTELATRYVDKTAEDIHAELGGTRGTGLEPFGGWLAG